LVTSWKYSISGNTMCVRVPLIPLTTHSSRGGFDPFPFFFLFYPPFFPSFLSLFIPEIHLWPSFYEPTRRRPCR
jgi:hypothetical protein